MIMGGFAGMRVLSLESRRSREMAQLITNNGGRATVAPSTREVPSGPNADELKFASELVEGRFAIVIFMTGVGTRSLVEAIASVCPREQFASALSRTCVVARGPKPVAALRELGVPIALQVPEPNTWREILQVLDDNAERFPLRNRQVAVQEHGEPSPELYAGLRERGAEVFPVSVYQWALPEDAAPLRDAVVALSRRQIDVVLFTSSVQVDHLFQIAEEMKLQKELVSALNLAMVASIGPVTSETLRGYGIRVSMQPTHPKMGFLVKEAADQSAELSNQDHR
jgi:uroporphyrinogen-III synthase